MREDIDTTSNSVTYLFVSAFNKPGGFLFDPANPYGFNAETLAAMDDAANGRNLSSPYKTVDEMLDALESDR